MASTSTLISVIGAQRDDAIAKVVGIATNVSTVAPLDDESELGRWRRATTLPPVYGLVGIDPLGPIVDAWARRLNGAQDDLELQIGLVGTPTTPDYYLVDIDLEAPHRSWYFEYVHSRAPARVLAVEMTPDAILRQIRTLPTGPAIPPVEDIRDGFRSFVPGTLAIGADTSNGVIVERPFGLTAEA